MNSLFDSLQILIGFGYLIKIAQTDKVKYPNSTYLVKKYCADYNWSFLPRICIEIRLPKGCIKSNGMNNTFKRIYIVPIIPKDKGLVKDLDGILECGIRYSNFKEESQRLRNEMQIYIWNLTKNGKEVLENFKEKLSNCKNNVRVENFDLEFYPYGSL